MAGNDVEMSHSEMWDDSALIESWNEALDEYKVSGRFLHLMEEGRRGN